MGRWSRESVVVPSVDDLSTPLALPVTDPTALPGNPDDSPWSRDVATSRARYKRWLHDLCPSDVGMSRNSSYLPWQLCIIRAFT